MHDDDVDDAFIMILVRVRLKWLRARVSGFLTDFACIRSVSQQFKMLISNHLCLYFDA